MRLRLSPFNPAGSGKLPCSDLLAVHAHARDLPEVLLRARRQAANKRHVPPPH